MATNGVRYRFGSFELDVASAELRKGGTPVKLPPQPFRALQLLVSRAGELVTRDELRAAVWPDDSFVDFNAGLNFCMAQLRNALAEPAGESPLIVTVPRRGYKFVAPVTSATGDRPVRRRAAAVTAAAMLLAGFLTFSATPDSRVLDRSVTALQKYDRGMEGLGDAAPGELLARVEYFEDALAGDAAWPEAWAGLAEAKLIIGNYRAEPPQSAYPTAKAAAAKALALDDRLGIAHTAFGAAVLYFAWDWDTADAHLWRGVRLASSSPRAHYWYSRLLSARGDHERAVEHAKRAVALAGTSPSVRTQLGLAYFYAGRFRDARTACAEASALMPEFQPASSCTTASDIESAAAPPEFWATRLGRLQDGRSEQELLDRTLSIAGTLVHAGNRSAALDALERAANRRTDVLIFAAVHPALRALSGEPRYRKILERVGLVKPAARTLSARGD